MDRQIILAVALSALVVLGYQEYLRIYYPNLGKKTEPAAFNTPSALPSALPAPVNPPSAPISNEPAAKEPPPQAGPAITIDTPLVTATVSSLGGRLTSLRLKHYRTTIDPTSPPLDLVSIGSDRDLPLGTVLRGTDSWSDENVVYDSSTPALTLEKEQGGDVLLRGKRPDGTAIEKDLHFTGDSYGFGVGLKVTDPSQRYTEAAIRWTHKPSL